MSSPNIVIVSKSGGYQRGPISSGLTDRSDFSKGSSGRKGRRRRRRKKNKDTNSGQLSQNSNIRYQFDDEALDFNPSSEEPVLPQISTVRKNENSAINRRKFVDLRPGKKGRSTDRLSTVKIEMKPGKKETARVSQVLNAFNKEISRDEKQEQREVLSSAEFKRTNEVDDRDMTLSFPPPRQTLVRAARKLVAGNDFDALRQSTSTTTTLMTVRTDEVMQPPEVDYGLTESQIENMNSNSLISHVNKNSAQEMNNTFGVEILEQDVAVKYNKKKRQEAAKMKRKMEKQEARNKFFQKINPFAKKPQESDPTNGVSPLNI